MNIINFDKYLSGDNKQIKHHYLLPDCHYMIVGSTGSGKTNLLLNMVLKWMNYDLCCVYTVNPEQDKYRFLKEQSIEVLSPEDLPSVEELDPQQKVIVFDDIKLDNMKKLMEYFSLSRNRNCNCIYLTQSYFNTPKYMRRNTNCFVFFGNLDNKDIRHITDDHAKGITKEEMESIYREATKDPYNFMVLDKTAKHLPLRYRKCFDHFWA